MNQTFSEIVVTSDTYAGNFQQEMAAFLFGATDWEMAPLLQTFVDARDPDLIDALAWAYDSTGETDTPLQIMTDEGYEAWTVLNPYSPGSGVMFRFSRVLTDEEVTSIASQVDKFIPAFEKKLSSPNAPTKLGVDHYIVEHTVRKVN